MELTLLICWYDRRPNGEPDYDRKHTGRIRGATPGECMHKYFELSNNHDLSRFTRTEIIGVY